MQFTNKQLTYLQKLYRLTNRELQIIRLLAEGKDQNKEIAEKLGLSLATTKIYLHNIYVKVGLNSKLGVTIRLLDHFQKEKT